MVHWVEMSQNVDRHIALALGEVEWGEPSLHSDHHHGSSSVVKVLCNFKLRDVNSLIVGYNFYFQDRNIYIKEKMLKPVDFFCLISVKLGWKFPCENIQEDQWPTQYKLRVE